MSLPRVRTTFVGTRAVIPANAVIRVELPCHQSTLVQRLVVLQRRALTINSLAYGTIELLRGLPLYRHFDEGVLHWPVLQPSILLVAHVWNRSERNQPFTFGVWGSVEVPRSPW